MENLVTAISQQDERGITESLAELRDIQDVAPAEIFEDFSALIDTTSDLVRALTDAPGPEGEDRPIDLVALGQDLEAVQKPAQNVATFADRECGLTLNP